MIDAHFHCWQLNQRNCQWPTADLKKIYRDFLPSDWRSASIGTDIKKAVLVQSQENISDTEWLLHLAEQNEFIAAVVGWLDLNSAEFETQLEKFKPFKKLRGLRPMLQGLADDRWILQTNVLKNLALLEKKQLSFDALILPRHLKVMNELIHQVPNLKIIIDHAAKPPIGANQYDAWAADMAVLSQHQQVWVKISGLGTEMAPGQGRRELETYLNLLADYFGEDKLIWGSDWPVIQLAPAPELATYPSWFEQSFDWVNKKGLNPNKIFNDNAARAYGLAD